MLPAWIGGEHDMGLAEKRMVAAYQKDQLPTWKQKLDGICGYPLAFEVAWDELVKEGWAEAYPKNLDYNFFQPLERSLQSICADQLGKDALKARIKKVRLASQRSWSSLEVKIEEETLILDADPTYNRDESCVDDYTQRITSELEKNL
jgi:hypothetical protein